MELELDCGDEYDKWCGEVFLTVKGVIIFHCSLCDDKFKGFPEYANHIKQTHFHVLFDDYDEDDEIDLTTEDDSSKAYKDTIYKYQQHEAALENDADLDIVGKNVNREEQQSTNLVNLKQIECEEITSSNEKHKCDVCGFAFTQLFNLRAHMRRHFNLKRFKCFQCPKQFHTRTELDTHERRHRGERPFVCEECGRTFVTGGALTMHVKRHRDIRNHECLECNKKFFDSHALKIHMVGHSEDRPFECVLCNATFSRKKALAVHKKIHENKREYQCTYCESSFNQKPGLYSHIKLKHIDIF